MKKTIALVDIYSAKLPGHYKAFMSFFAQSILSLDHHVLVLMPDKDAIDDWVTEYCPEKLQNYHSFHYIQKSKKHENMGRFNAAFDALSLWKNAQKQLKSIEKTHHHRIDLVFLNFLDVYLANYLSPWLIRRVFSYKWAGLYFHPWHLRMQSESLNAHPSISEIDSALNAKKCQGIAIHDEGITENYQKRLKNKKVILFPEIADGTNPNPQLELVAKIKEKAKGRTIIGMIGFVHYKGLNTLIRVARQANADDLFFVFAGKWSRKGGVSYTRERVEEANQFFDNPPENCFVHLDFIKEGGDFNAVFCSFDIPFLVYDNFASSSNNLTKAAIFNKLVVASKGYCVGDDVNKYELGLTVEQGNVQQCIDAIYQLKNQSHDLKPKFEQYKNIHSKEVLHEKFQELIDLS